MSCWNDVGTVVELLGNVRFCSNLLDNIEESFREAKSWVVILARIKVN